MDLNRLRLLLAAPLASLFLVLSLCAFVTQRPASSGFLIPMVRLHHDPQEPLGCDGRPEFIRLTHDEKTWINEAEVPSDQLPHAISDLMENRAERVVYVIVDSDLSYGQFAAFLDRIANSTTDLRVVVVSGEVLIAFKKRPDHCDFVYPINEFAPPWNATAARLSH